MILSIGHGLRGDREVAGRVGGRLPDQPPGAGPARHLIVKVDLEAGEVVEQIDVGKYP